MDVGGHEGQEYGHIDKLTSYDARFACQLHCMHVYMHMAGVISEGSLGRWNVWCPAIASRVSTQEWVNKNL